MSEVSSLASISTKSILSSEKAILKIGYLPNRLQQHLFVSAIESDRKNSIPLLFKACTLKKVDADQIAIDESSNHEDVIAETLLFAYMSALRTLQSWTPMPELHISKLNLRSVQQEINETRRYLESNPGIGEGYTIKTGLLSVSIVVHLGLSPEAGLSKFLSENMVTRRGSPKFRVVYKSAHVSCDDYPDFIKDVLDYLDNDIESLSLDCNSSLRSPLVVLKRFGRLKNLSIKTIENGNDLRHLGSALGRMKQLENLSVESIIESHNGPIKTLLKGRKTLKGFKYRNELISDNDLDWLGESVLRKTLIALDFSGVDLRSSNKMSNVFANFEQLEALSLQNCSLSKSQVVQLCDSIQDFQLISVIILDQHTEEAESFTDADSIEILTPLLRTQSKQLRKVLIDVPLSQELKLRFIADCRKCIEDHKFGNVRLISSVKTLSDEHAYMSEVVHGQGAEASFLRS